MHVRFSAAAALWPKHEAAQETFLLPGLSGFVTAADKRFVFVINVASNVMRITILGKFRLPAKYLKIFDTKHTGDMIMQKYIRYHSTKYCLVQNITYIVKLHGLHIIISSSMKTCTKN